MYTQCPSCQTIFQVSAEQLKAANGDVRCGQCLTIFSALDHLSEEVPSHENDDTNETEVFSQETEQTKASPDEDRTDLFDDPELEEFFSDVTDDLTEESALDYETRIKKYTPVESKVGFFYGGANEATIEKILSEHEPEERELEEFTAPSEPPSDVTQTDTPDEVALNTDQPEKKIGEEKIGNAANIPSLILDDLQADQAAQIKDASNRSWLVGSVALMMILILQAVYFSRHDLARDPSLRPTLAKACEMLGCSIDVAYDIKLIEIIGRDVRSHPSAQKALIAGTTIINNAKFPQPYPLLTLTFSNITGTTLAKRRFTPREYLKSGTDIKAGMTPDLPVQVELELVDPGKAAVNFEFHAETDPRAQPPSRG